MITPLCAINGSDYKGMITDDAGDSAYCPSLIDSLAGEILK
jgi:hypothetical protein